MKYVLGLVICFFSVLLLSDCTTEERTEQFIDYVDPLIGAGGHGHVFVGANVPFGAVQIGPNNIYKGWDWCSGYNYADSLIIGFSQLHLSGTGIGDLADILIMPYTGEEKLDKGKQEYPHGGYLSTFKHENETAEVGYYKVGLDNGVEVELTATERVGYHRYYFPKGEDSHVIIDLKEGINDRVLESSLKKIDDYTLVGTRFSSGWAKEQQVYFAIRTSAPIDKLKIFDEKELVGEKQAEGKAIKGLINIEKGTELFEMKVGISPVSVANAIENIEQEIPNWDFDGVVKSAKKKWNKELSKIKIETDNQDQRSIFYTAMYHSFMHPSLFNDHNGSYQGADNKIYENAAFDNYSIFSTWDTYRASHPLFTIIQSERMNDFVNTMLAIYDEQGYLPIWHLNGYETGTMVGISSLQIIAEAYLKGYNGFDAERAYAAIKATAMSNLRGMDYQKEFKAIPSDGEGKHGAVANALELSIADGSIALMAKGLGKMEDYKYFQKRAQNYKIYYNEKTQFFQGKMKDGSWNPNFDPIKSRGITSRDYTEGNAWQYLWLVPQDVSGLIDLLGGDENFNSRLDTFFTLSSENEEEVLDDLSGAIGQYAHGNEPSHHISYLYAYSGEQWKTAEKTDQIMQEFYKADMDGIIGNEDCGQMSAWYIFSSLGFYPVFPASQKYVIGSPLFKKAKIELPNGKSFIVETSNYGENNIYVQHITLNGDAYTKSFITHQDIMAGGVMKVEMGAKPNLEFGTALINRP